MPQHFLGEIIEEAKADEVGLWFIIGRIRDDLGIKDPRLLREATLHCIRELLASGAVVAGYYKQDGFGIDVWDMDAEKIVSRIEDEWNVLGREPNIGEVVVFIANQSNASS